LKNRKKSKKIVELEKRNRKSLSRNLFLLGWGQKEVLKKFEYLLNRLYFSFIWASFIPLKKNKDGEYNNNVLQVCRLSQLNCMRLIIQQKHWSKYFQRTKKKDYYKMSFWRTSLMIQYSSPLLYLFSLSFFFQISFCAGIFLMNLVSTSTRWWSNKVELFLFMGFCLCVQMDVYFPKGINFTKYFPLGKQSNQITFLNIVDRNWT